MQLQPMSMRILLHITALGCSVLTFLGHFTPNPSTICRGYRPPFCLRFLDRITLACIIRDTHLMLTPSAQSTPGDP